MVRGYVGGEEDDMYNFKKIGPFTIDWHGAKSVCIHALMLGLGYVAMQLEAYVTGQNFGQYQIVVMGINSVLFKFIQKFCTSYGVPIA